MRRRKGKRMGSMSILCITAIVGLSAMGVGYGYWNDNLNIGVGVSTGFIKPEFVFADLNIIQNDGELQLRLLEDKTTLIVEGWIYSSFRENIGISVTDNGSVPTLLEGINLETGNEVIDLTGNGSYFELNINPAINNIEESFLNYQEDHDVYELIQNLDTVTDPNFKYKIRFRQGL